ncbi:MAG TPA: SpoIID/LytB domain-containing protein [Terriglobales bacterium]|nr:SpoIID/LytB domain-containing protein [Terriglobales bacterium]
MKKAAEPAARRWPTAALVLVLTPVVLSSGEPAHPAAVRVGVFGLFRPQELVLSAPPGATLTIKVSGNVISLAGGQSARLRLTGGGIECRSAERRLTGTSVQAWPSDAGEFQLAVPGRIERRYRGNLEVRVSGRALQPVVTMDLEVAVASAVAAESPPGAPLEALKAQAVVTRSYYVAGGGRHAAFDFCDTTHCQFLRHPPEKDNPAWLATAATRGLVLSYEGKVLPALYSASCGGRTRTLAETGMRGDRYPYFSVACPEHAEPWERRLSAADGKRLLSGNQSEGSRLELGRRRGWSAVPGNNYEAEHEGDHILLRGRGLGHGLGLCQRGAAHMAARGAGFLQILNFYYANTTIAR